MEIKERLDEALAGVEDAAKEKIKGAVEEAVKAKVKKELKKRRKKAIRRVIILGVAAAGAYLAWTYREEIADFAEEKAKEVKKALK